MDQLGLKSAMKAWASATAALLIVLGIEGPPTFQEGGDAINWIALVAAPLVGYAVAWFAPKNQ